MGGEGWCLPGEKFGKNKKTPQKPKTC